MATLMNDNFFLQAPLTDQGVMLDEDAIEDMIEDNPLMVLSAHLERDGHFVFQTD